MIITKTPAQTNSVRAPALWPVAAMSDHLVGHTVVFPRGHFGPGGLICGFGCQCVGGFPFAVLSTSRKHVGLLNYSIDSPHIRAHNERAHYEKTNGSKLSWDAAGLEWNAADRSARESTVEDFCGETNLIPRWPKGKVEPTKNFPKTLAEKIKQTKFHSLMTEDNLDPGGFWAQQLQRAADGPAGQDARNAAEKILSLQANLKAELATPTTALVSAYLHVRLLKVLGAIAVKNAPPAQV